MSRNLGIFSRALITQDDLMTFGLGLGGRELGASALVFGEFPEAAYLGLETDLSGGCFDGEEIQEL